MFAYCNNNPVSLADPSGYLPLNQSAYTCIDFSGSGRNSTYSPREKLKSIIRSLLENIHLTSTTGIAGNGTPFGMWGGAFQIGRSVDAQGNSAVQGSLVGGITTASTGVAIGYFEMITNAPDIYHLEGMGYQLGGSVQVSINGVPIVIGIDVNIIPDSANGKNYFGLTRMIGIGTPGEAEGHVEWGNTSTVFGTEYNILDLLFMLL